MAGIVVDAGPRVKIARARHLAVRVDRDAHVGTVTPAIGDLLDEKKESNRARNSAVALMTVSLVAFYSFTRYFH